MSSRAQEFIREALGWSADDLVDSRLHRFQTGAPITGFERFPSEPARQAGVPREIAESADRVMRCFELKEKRRKRLGPESEARRRSPEVNLGDLPLGAQELIPLVVSRGDRPVQCVSLARRQPSRSSLRTILRPRVEGNRRAWGSLVNSIDDCFEHRDALGRKADAGADYDAIIALRI